MAGTGEIFKLDGVTKSDVNGVADLHESELGDSPVVMFGDGFLRGFYYGSLVRDGLIDVIGCRVDGRVVGFIAYAREPLGFMTGGVKRHPFRLAGLLATSILRRPSTVGPMITAVRLMLDRKGEERAGEAPADRGEVLSVACERKFQKLVPEGGTSRLTMRLFEEMVDDYRSSGFSALHLHVKPENMASNMFCASLGCTFEKIEQAGITTHRYIYDIPPA